MSGKKLLKYLVVIKPLGMLYGSAGPFLSPENLVGRSGDRFPPSSATVAGLYGAKYWEGAGSLDDLFIVGPFWAETEQPASFYVPTPLNFRIERDRQWDTYGIVERWQWQDDSADRSKCWSLNSQIKEKKSLNNSWICIDKWHQLQTAGTAKIDPPIPVILASEVWQHNPHLHPRMEDDERHVARANEANSNDLPAQQGSLFLENGVQMHPDRCLVYLSSRQIAPGCYRFGGEGHLADLECIKIAPDSSISKLMQQPMGDCFSLLTPAVWGTQRLSYRFPVPAGTAKPATTVYPVSATIQSDSQQEIGSFWAISALMTERPIPFRFRLGGTGKTKRLSRGRYAVPAGTVYQVDAAIPAWQEWQPEWFPHEGYSYQHWGCGFALPLTLPTNL
jgi:CRISPR-associated protein Cmr3